MKIKKGYPLPLGVSEKDGYINFSVTVASGKRCILKLYKRGEAQPEYEIELSEADSIGDVRFISIQRSMVKGFEYNYEIDKKVYVDPYAKAVVEQDGVHTRGRVVTEDYDWEDDKPLQIPEHEVIAYSLHVRGFTKHGSSKVKKKGTLQGVIEKIPYLTELGINQIQCMPVYSFEEYGDRKNYWGYGSAFCFAVKNTYAAGKNAERELKDMVKACHKAGIEVVLDLPFDQIVPKTLILECLRYYVVEYHVDGFIVNPYLAPMENILTDALLKKTKILENRDDFQNTMRRFLKGDEGMVESVMWWIKQRSKKSRCYNYITKHTGFTMADLVSYDEKHNEENGEDNHDGPDYNYSWNCGAEGKTYIKAVLALRKRQIRNAFFILMSAQGTPCILAGDEFGNSQNGNNNVYCQDNEIAWLNWKDLDKNKDIYEYVKKLIAVRKKIPYFHLENPLLGIDLRGSGVPDISFHGKYAWQSPIENSSRRLGVYYHDEKQDITDCYVAYNMHWEEKLFALPTLAEGKKWYRIYSTANDAFELEKPIVEKKKETMVDGRAIDVFIGR